VKYSVAQFAFLTPANFDDIGMCVSRGTDTGGSTGAAEQGQKIRVGMTHPGNFSRGLKTSWQVAIVCQ